MYIYIFRVHEDDDLSTVVLRKHSVFCRKEKRTGKLTQTLLDNKGNKFIRRKVRKNIIYLNCNVPSCSAKAQAFSEDPANMELEPTIMRLDREHLLCDGSGTAHAPEPGAYHDYFDKK